MYHTLHMEVYVRQMTRHECGWLSLEPVPTYGPTKPAITGMPCSTLQQGLAHGRQHIGANWSTCFLTFSPGRGRDMSPFLCFITATQIYERPINQPTNKTILSDPKCEVTELPCTVNNMN